MLFCVSVKPFPSGIQSCFLFQGVAHRSQDKGWRWGPQRRKAGVFLRESFVRLAFSIKKIASFYNLD